MHMHIQNLICLPARVNLLAFNLADFRKMKRVRPKAAAAAPAVQRLNPVALRTTSATRDSQASSAFSSGSHSTLLSAKDVSIIGTHVVVSAALLANSGLRQRQKAKRHKELVRSPKS
jgi:hypothetical protein